MSFELQIVLIAALAAAACALPGVFLVLRRMVLMCDAISHVVLFGIVLIFFVVKDLDSPFLAVGAAVTGLVTVVLVEALARTGRVKKDAAIGIVFPIFFSAAIIMVSRKAGQVHLDTDSVLLGELVFAPFNRFNFNGTDLGPKGLWSMAVIFIANAGLITLFYKELKLATFDTGLAASLGFAPAAVHYGLMAMVSITAVEAFDVVGSILVVAMMVAPAASAWLLTDNLLRMLLISVGLGVVGAMGGYWMSYQLDASIAGCMATMLGIIFACTWLAAPQRGFISLAMRRRRQKVAFAGSMLTIHLLHHEHRAEAQQENRVAHLGEHLRWGDHFAMTVVRFAEREGLVTRSDDGSLTLTSAGRNHAQKVVTE